MMFHMLVTVPISISTPYFLNCTRHYAKYILKHPHTYTHTHKYIYIYVCVCVCVCVACFIILLKVDIFTKLSVTLSKLLLLLDQYLRYQSRYHTLQYVVKTIIILVLVTYNETRGQCYQTFLFAIYGFS
jgi:hypothetical protein